MPIYNHYYPDAANQINTEDSVARLALTGPTIPVAIGLPVMLVSYYQSQGLPIPDPIFGLALIDTGASLCAVDDEAVRSLAIPPFGVQPMHTAGGSVDQLTYPASLAFPGTELPNISFVDFVGAPLAASGIIALIGRSVLRDFVMVYNGPAGSLSLAY